MQGIDHKGKVSTEVFGGTISAVLPASTFFSDEVIKTGRIWIRDYKTIYFIKTIGDQPFSVGVNPWTRRIFHEGPGVFK